jgi:DNA-directed RNA polymerase subunit L
LEEIAEAEDSAETETETIVEVSAETDEEAQIVDLDEIDQAEIQDQMTEEKIKAHEDKVILIELIQEEEEDSKMKIEVITQDKEGIEFFITGERHTLPNLLKGKLMEDSDVDFCAYRLDHPLDKRARFVVKGKSPKKSLENAIKSLKGDIAEFKKAFEKAK